MSHQVVAKAILEAAKLREESWDGLRYTVSKHQAAKSSSPDEATFKLVYILICAAWNSSIEWAEEMIHAA